MLNVNGFNLNNGYILLICSSFSIYNAFIHTNWRQKPFKLDFMMSLIFYVRNIFYVVG